MTLWGHFLASGTLFARLKVIMNSNPVGSPRTVFGRFGVVARPMKRPVALLAAIALGGGMLLIRSAQPTATEARAEKPGPEGSTLFASDPNFFGRTDGPGTGELVSKAMMAIVLVVALGAAAIYVSRKFLPRITNLPGKEIHIIETVHLGPRKIVHLVKIGNQRLLIGSTNESITMLADVSDGSPETDLSTPERAPFLENTIGR